jgi:hypothetical protein
MRDVNVPEMKEGMVRRLFDKIGPYTPIFGSRIKQGAETRAKLREAARDKEIARQETQMLEQEVRRAVTPNSLTPSNVNRMSR